MERTTRPDCRQCRHHELVMCDTRSRCLNPAAQVRGNLHGVAHGYFNFPYVYDPIWVDGCDGFAPVGEASTQKETAD